MKATRWTAFVGGIVLAGGTLQPILDGRVVYERADSVGHTGSRWSRRWPRSRFRPTWVMTWPWGASSKGADLDRRKRPVPRIRIRWRNS